MHATTLDAAWHAEANTPKTRNPRPETRTGDYARDPRPETRTSVRYGAEAEWEVEMHTTTADAVFRFRVSGFGLQFSGFRLRASGFGFLVSGVLASVRQGADAE